MNHKTSNLESQDQSKKAHRNRLIVNSKRSKEYSHPFNLFNQEDYRLFCKDPVSYVERIRPNTMLSLRSLVDSLLHNVTTPSQNHIGSCTGLTRQSVNAHFGSLESSGVIGSHYYFKQNSAYCLNGIFYNKKIAYKLRFLLPELYLGQCFTLYNSKEYYTPHYVPSDSPDPNLFDRFSRNCGSCIPFFFVNEKKDRVSPHNYNLIRGSFYEEGDQERDMRYLSYLEQVNKSTDNCVCTDGFNYDPYADYTDQVFHSAHAITVKALQNKEINYNDDEILEFHEKQLVRLRDAEKERERAKDTEVNSILESIINGDFLKTRNYAVHKTRKK